jgi:hypothetical protein
MAASDGAAAVAAVALTISRRTGRGNRLHDLPVSVRAHALITVGKLCICDSSVAKTFVPALVHALEQSADGTIKTNILIILGDLCRRYTNIVDAHIGMYRCVVLSLSLSLSLYSCMRVFLTFFQYIVLVTCLYIY